MITRNCNIVAFIFYLVCKPEHETTDGFDISSQQTLEIDKTISHFPRMFHSEKKLKVKATSMSNFL